MTIPARFKQSDVKRAMAAARDAGFNYVRIGIDVHGNIVIEASNDISPPVYRANPLDRLLDRK